MQKLKEKTRKESREKLRKEFPKPRACFISHQTAENPNESVPRGLISQKPASSTGTHGHQAVLVPMMTR